MIAVEIATVIAEDILVAEAATRPTPEPMLAARIDVSGLLAIGASDPGLLPVGLGDGTILDGDWLAHADHGGDDSLLSRHSA